MPLIRTLTAVCDGKITDQGREVPCEATLAIDPNITQVWIAIIEQGWVVDHQVEPDVSFGTYCPTHAKGVL